MTGFRLVLATFIDENSARVFAVNAVDGGNAWRARLLSTWAVSRDADGRVRQDGQYLVLLETSDARADALALEAGQANGAVEGVASFEVLGPAYAAWVVRQPSLRG